MDTVTIRGTLVSGFTWTGPDSGTFLLMRRDLNALPFQIVKLKTSDYYNYGNPIGLVEWEVGKDLTVVLNLKDGWAYVIEYSAEKSVNYLDATKTIDKDDPLGDIAVAEFLGQVANLNEDYKKEVLQ